MFGLKHRELLPNWAQIELDQLVQGVKTYLLAEFGGEHNEDGTHADVTADSLDVIGSAGVGDDLVVDRDTRLGRHVRLFNDTDLSVLVGAMGGIPPQRDIALSATTYIGSLGALPNDRFMLKITSAAFTPRICGIAPPSVSLDEDGVIATMVGAYYLIVNDSGDTVEIIHDNAGAGGGVTTGGIYTPDSKVFYLYPNCCVLVAYDVNAAGVLAGRWRIFGTSFPLSGWESYTPTWTGAVSNPAIGNGTLEAHFYRVGKKVHFRLRMVAGSTTTFGSGAWSFTLPSTVASPNLVAFNGYANDSGGLYHQLSGINASATTFQLVTNALVTGASPFAWGTADRLVVNGFYDEA